ncbi:hypothetical protein HanPI659440_Chr10g0365181 [Helianthus annuus]|nr:hypothetical protein HanPI659440_Chr10g0365181 [Helianthus annuus]
MYPKANGIASPFRCVHDRHKKISDEECNPVKSDVFPSGYLGFLWCLGCKLPKEALYSRRGFIPVHLTHTHAPDFLVAFFQFCSYLYVRQYISYRVGPVYYVCIQNRVLWLCACRITTLCKQNIGSHRFWCSGKE